MEPIIEVDCSRCGTEGFELDDAEESCDGFYNKETKTFICEDCVISEFKGSQKFEDMAQEMTAGNDRMKIPAFDLLTYTKSNTALRNGIDNTPSPEEIENLKKIHKHIFRFVWKYVCIPKGKHLFITSGYRCKELNKLVKGQPDSRHLTGQAVDFEVMGVSNFKLWQYLAKNLPSYNKLILEYWEKGKPQSGRIHVSYVSPEYNKMKAFQGNYGKK